MMSTGQRLHAKSVFKPTFNKQDLFELLWCEVEGRTSNANYNDSVSKLEENLCRLRVQKSGEEKKAFIL